jgi:AraC-like DNA-binding protein
VPAAHQVRAKIPQQSPELVVLSLLADEPVVLTLAAPSLVITVESAVASIRSGSAAITLDRAGVLVAPRGDVLTFEAVGPSSRVAIVGLVPRVLALAERDYAKLGFERGKLSRWTRTRAELPRTVWVHELVHRYVFERHALGETDNLATRFLEIELAKEVFFLFRDREQGAERATLVRAYSASIERALAYVEANLWSLVNIAKLARAAGASASTLGRAFHAEVGCSPGAYWRNRKLDEALLALRAGRTVADVATRVGYENPTAFGFAFRRRFGRPPSAFRPTGRTRLAP